MTNKGLILNIYKQLIQKEKKKKTVEKWDTYLAGEIPWSRRWFAPGETYPLHSGCADPSDFSKCGKLGCITCGGGGLHSYMPLSGKKWAKEVDVHFSKEEMQMANRHLKRLLIIREVQIKITIICHCTSLRVAINKKKTNVKCCQDVEKRKHLYTVGGNVNWCSHYGNRNGGFSKK